MPLFSVIIPLYNKEALIGRTLTSALAQSYTDFEVIIINDGSTDNSKATVLSYNDKRIKYFETENKGVSPARNLGIEKASGKIIAFLDADDYWTKNHLEVLYKLSLDFPAAGMLASRYNIKIGQKKVINPVFVGIDENYRGIVSNPFKASLINRLTVTSAVAVHKHVFDKTGAFNINVTHPEDTELWTKIMLEFPVAISNVVTMEYNFDLPDSWSRKKMKHRKIMDFNQFASYEVHNKSLKAYMDLYRLEYALKFRTEGDLENSAKLYKAVSASNIKPVTKFLMMLPPVVLRNLLFVKHWLHRKGISFSVYH